ncbi:MAG: MOSC domain-containing protein [Epsilonproteobacteria bacterium]|nr:MOSC domain-containing protein [Campylobacterota bacterium]MBA1419285.1 MOSC domain-containing protein [Campylobacterota bacterium]
MKEISIGNISALFISQRGSSTRETQPSIHLDLKGISHDKFYDKDIHRSVLITSKESYTLAQKHHIEMPYGSLGENLLIDYNPYHLPSGTQLSIGTCILEISQNCTLCDHLSSIDKRLPTLLKHDRGIFAKVTQEGEIKEDDEIFLIEKPTS